MIKKLKTILLVALAVIGLSSVFALQPALVDAQTPKELACEGAQLGANCEAPEGSPTIDDTLATVVNVISFIVGFAAVLMIIIGGFRYVTSGGDSNATSGAKNTILYAIIGLVVVALAQIIVRFVIQKV